jgi:hypothetical protein
VQLARKGFDTKRLVGLAFLLMTVGLWNMTKWNVDVGCGK